MNLYPVSQDMGALLAGSNPATGQKLSPYHAVESDMLTRQNTGILAKLLAKTKNVNIENILKNQQTTRYVFDSVQLGTLVVASGTPTPNFTTENLTNLSFFTNLNTKDANLTNINTNQFTAGETMVVEEIFLSILVTKVNGGGINVPLSISPVSVGANIFPYNFGGSPISFGQLSLTINGQEILKQVPYVKALAAFNRASKWGTGVNSVNGDLISQAADNGLVNPNIYGVANDYLDVPSHPVIVPNVQFKATYQIPATTFAVPTGFYSNEGSSSAGTYNVYLQMYMGGYGTLAGTNGGM
jgi:hypothetical protein